MIKEKWITIIDYCGYYEVSNFGRIRSLERLTRAGQFVKERILKFTTNNYGYFAISFWRDNKIKTFKVHRLVAQAFIPNPHNKPEVNHINGVKTDNRAVNLEWCDHAENIRHAVRMGLHNQKGENGSNAKLKREEVLEICNSRKRQVDLSAQYGVAISIISSIQTGFLWSSVTGRVYKRKHKK